MNDYDLSPVHIETRNGMTQRVSDMEAVEKLTGHTFGEIMAAGSSLTFKAFALIELRKRDRKAGRESDLGELWEIAGDIDIVMGDEAMPTRPDPLDAISS